MNAADRLRISPSSGMDDAKAPEIDGRALARSHQSAGRHHLALRSWRALLETSYPTPEIISNAMLCAHKIRDHAVVVELAMLAYLRRVHISGQDVAIVESAILRGQRCAADLLDASSGMFADELIRCLRVTAAFQAGDLEEAESLLRISAIASKECRALLTNEILRLRILREPDETAAIRRCCEALARGRMSMATGAAVAADRLGGESRSGDSAFMTNCALLAELMPPSRLIVLCQILRRSGHLSLAEQLALSGLVAHPDSRELLMERAAGLRAVDRSDEAIAIYDGLSNAAAPHEGALDAMVDCLVAQRHLDEASRRLDQWVARNPSLSQSFSVLMSRCKLAAARRDHAAAARFASAGLACDPTSIPARVRLATAYMARVDFAPALSTLSDGLALNPTDANLLLPAAACCRALGLDAEAKVLFTTLARNHPANARFIAIMGEWLPLAGDHAYGDILAAVDETDVSARDREYALAALAYENGEAEQAIAAILQMADRYPGGLDAREASVLAKGLVSMRRTSEAVAVLEPFLDKPSAEVLKDYMNALMSAGLYDTAARLPLRFPAQFDTDYVQFTTVHARLNARLGRDGSDWWWNEYRSAPHAKLLRSGQTELNYEPDITAFREAASAIALPALGVGDEIRFASIYSEVIGDRQPAAFLCDPRLRSIFSRSFPDATFIGSERRGSSSYTPAIVAWAAGLPDQELARLMDYASYRQVRDFEAVILVADLLEHYRPNASHFGKREAYLVADPQRVADASRLMATSARGPKIGLTWRSSLLRTARLANYTSLDAWGDVFAIPGATFYSFQHDASESEIASAEQKFGIQIRRFPGVDLKDDFESVAGLLMNLDVLAGPAVAALEFAAALGVEVAMMWRVPNGRYRLRPDGRDLWHGSMTPIFGEPMGDERSMLSAVARHIKDIATRRS